MSKNGKIKVVVVDDHALIREAVRTLLAEHKRIELVGEGSVGEQVLPLVKQHRPDVLLLDISMPQSTARQDKEIFSIEPTLKILQERYKETKVIILSQYLQKGLLSPSMRSCMSGYLLKSDDLSLKLGEAIEVVNRGGVYFSQAVNHAETQINVREITLYEITLTKRQKEILLTIAQDPESPYKKVAEEMCITERTLKWHLTSIYRKLGVNNIRAAILVCIEYDLIPEMMQSGVGLNM